MKKILSIFLSLLVISQTLTPIMATAEDNLYYAVTTLDPKGALEFRISDENGENSIPSYCYNASYQQPNNINEGLNGGKGVEYSRGELTPMELFNRATTPIIPKANATEETARMFLSKVYTVLLNGYPIDYSNKIAESNIMAASARQATQAALWQLTNGGSKYFKISLYLNENIYPGVNEFYNYLINKVETESDNINVDVAMEVFPLFTTEEPVDNDAYTKRQNLLGVTMAKNELPSNILTSNNNLVNIKVSKINVAGAEISGASIIIKDANGEIVEQWTSGNTPKELSIPIGTYTFHEESAPSGYIAVTDITFTVTQEGTIIIDNTNGNTVSIIGDTLSVTDQYATSIVSISKVDENNNAVNGATLKIFKDDTELDSWVTDGTAHTCSLLDGNYTLKETNAPEGYLVAEDINFVIRDGQVHVIENNQEILMQNNVIAMVDESEKIDVTVTKLWLFNGTPIEDSESLKTFVPDSVTVELLANGEKVDEAVLNEDSNWINVFTGVPKYDDEGVLISYTINEVENPYCIARVVPDEVVPYSFSLENDLTGFVFEKQVLPIIPGTEDKTQEFNFKVLISADDTLEEGTIVKGIKETPTYNENGEFVEYVSENVTFTVGTEKAVTLKHGTRVTLAIPEGTVVRVSEDACKGYVASIFDEADNKYINSNTWENEVLMQRDEPQQINYTNKLTFNNTKAFNFQVEKQVTGNQGDRDKQFEFELTLRPTVFQEPEPELWLLRESKNEAPVVPTYKGTIIRKDGTTEEITITAETPVRFTLADGDVLNASFLDLLDYTIKEINASGYDTTIKKGEDVTSSSETSGSIESDTEITFINDRSSEPQTGLNTMLIPFIMFLSIASLLTILKLKKNKQ